MFSAMKYEQGMLRLVDQRLLPTEEVWLDCSDLEACAGAIEDMVVRGAPAIGCVAAFALAMDSRLAADCQVWQSYKKKFAAACSRLAETRPTAVNLFYVLDKMKALGASFDDKDSMAYVASRIEQLAHDLYDDDLKTCQAIGRHGAALAGERKLRILTHCNTGSLATAGYGTALGVIRALSAQQQVEIVYVDETRPYLQGSRLTAFELSSEKVPYKIVVDSAAAWLMQQNKVDWVVVGADRVAANGDTANKIGTYALAVQCRHHGVEFYVAAPLSTFDPTLADGRAIPVEERHPSEILMAGGRQMAPGGAAVYNPSFDITPGELITGIITEKGVIKGPFKESINQLLKS